MARFFRYQFAAINAELQRLEVGSSDLYDTANAVEDEDELEALSIETTLYPPVPMSGAWHRPRPTASTNSSLERGAWRCEELGAYDHFFFSSRILPDPRRRSLLSPARMAHRIIMGSPTCGFGRPHAVRLSLERKVATRCGPSRARQWDRPRRRKGHPRPLWISPQATRRRRKSPGQARRGSDARFVTKFKRSARGPQSGQNHQGPDLSVCNSFDVDYGLITSQTWNVQVHRTTGDREDIAGAVNCPHAWPAVSANRSRRCSR